MTKFRAWLLRLAQRWDRIGPVHDSKPCLINADIEDNI